MSINLPYKLRAFLYILISIGTPIVGYAFAKGFIGELEVALWGSLATVTSTIAVFNVKK